MRKGKTETLLGDLKLVEEGKYRKCIKHCAKHKMHAHHHANQLIY